MSSEKCSPHTEQVDMIILFYTCIFEFFEKNIPTPIEKKTNSGINL